MQFTKADPDILLTCRRDLKPGQDHGHPHVQETLTEQPHVLSVKEIQSQGSRRAPPF